MAQGRRGQDSLKVLGARGLSEHHMQPFCDGGCILAGDVARVHSPGKGRSKLRLSDVSSLPKLLTPLKLSFCDEPKWVECPQNTSRIEQRTPPTQAL